MFENSEGLASDRLTAAAVPDGRSAAIDHAHLRRYTMGDLQLEAEVLALFANELPRTLASLQAAATVKDWKIAAHTLKGSARSVGAWRVAAAAVDAEQAIIGRETPAGKTAVLAACERAVRDAVGYISTLNGLRTQNR